ncbi:O-antigen ligase family protein [Aquincola tertiaricarbonis]|uniref:O-antigen ligase family protein n=1 Tax=Aquincola tertiaricarbonis TaxID=391953 RepID=A0ABY4SE79_AQUTE|nr:O-antigen ligase family protein [Aquincola tertiaricarbonis]URI09509.1 O-antigen ligase family protein [Aquincola tertiaricarbonis]
MSVVFWVIASLIVIGVAFGIAVALRFVQIKRWLWLSALSTTFMFYALPIAGVYLSVNLLSGLAAVRSVFDLRLWRVLWVKLAAAMTACLVVSMAWSPSPISGFRDLVYTLPFFFICAAAMQCSLSDKAFAKRVLGGLVVLASIQAILVIIFRLSPTIEARFITSRLAQFFISPNVIAGLFSGSPNNIFDPGKAGGLFVNANAAAAYMGCIAMVGWYLGRAERWWVVSACAALSWCAVFFTGSKAGTICAVFIPSFQVGLTVLRAKRVGIATAALVCFLVAAGALAAPFVWLAYTKTGFTQASTETLSVRQVIWSFAWSMFKQHPFGGLGHGGWEERFPLYALALGINPNYPAHNAFIILWSKGGLLAGICGIGFAASFLQWAFANSFRLSSEASRTFCLGLAWGFLWVLIQALGENFGLIGEPHIASLLAIASGIAIGEHLQSTTNNDRD